MNMQHSTCYCIFYFCTQQDVTYASLRSNIAVIWRFHKSRVPNYYMWCIYIPPPFRLSLISCPQRVPFDDGQRYVRKLKSGLRIPILSYSCLFCFIKPSGPWVIFGLCTKIRAQIHAKEFSGQRIRSLWKLNLQYVSSRLPSQGRIRT